MLTRLLAMGAPAVVNIDLPKEEPPTLFLTFDDGPDIKTTPKVLEILSKHDVQATFFLVANRAKSDPRCVQDIVSEGHSIGNHSLDHKVWHLFKGQSHLTQWVSESESRLTSIVGKPSVGFRPPAGVCPPPLVTVLRRLGLPLILWQKRYFDRSRVWNESRAIHSVSCLKRGDIILLHDGAPKGGAKSMSRTLDRYLAAAKSFGFVFSRLETQHLRKNQ